MFVHSLFWKESYLCRRLNAVQMKRKSKRSKGNTKVWLTVLVALAVCYVFGTAWFCVITDSGVAAAMSACVLPFIPGDIIKMAVALIICPEIKKSLKSAF